MSEFFYGNSPVAVTTTTQQLQQDIEIIREIIQRQNPLLELIAINTLYRNSIICKEERQLVAYTAHDGKLKRQYGFNSKWEDAPNYIQIKDIGIGQQDLF